MPNKYNLSAASDIALEQGNIRFMQTTLTKIDYGTPMPMLNAYKYDQLNRLLEARSYESGLSGNTWSPTGYNNEYFNKFEGACPDVYFLGF